MNVTLKMGTLVLADGTWSVGVLTGELPRRVQRLIDKTAPIGASGPKNYDRVTRSTDLELTVTRQHASAGAAVGFWATHDTVATGVATFTLIVTDDSGAGVNIAMAGAAWEAVTVEPMGVSTDTTYRVSGGTMTATTFGGGGEPGTELVGVRDSLLEQFGGGVNPYGPAPGVAYFPAPWNSGLPSAAAVTSVTLADMAS